MRRKELISEITTDLRQYDDAGLIDYRTLNRLIRNELKRFGSNLMILTEKYLEVKDGKAELPDNFFSLHMALKADKDSYYLNNDCKHIIEQSNHWTQRLESTYVWDNQANTHKQQDFKCIEERVIRKDCDVTIRYKNPTLLKLTKGIKRDTLSPNCKNLRIKNAPYEININGNTLYTNFNKGTILIVFYGLPTDDEGDLLIPDIRSLEEYLIAYCRRKILEGMYYNDEDTNLINKLQLAKQEERELFGFAKTAVAFENLPKDWHEKIRYKNIMHTRKYENMFPNQ
jgi:hypothetical protein